MGLKILVYPVQVQVYAKKKNKLLYNINLN